MMIWKICFFLSLGIILVCVPLFIFQRFVQRKRLNTAIRTLFIGFFVALFLLILPIKSEMLGESWISFLRALMVSFNRTLKAFTFSEVATMETLMSQKDAFYDIYAGTMTLMCFICPFLGLSYILSFFSKIRASTNLLISYNRDLYVFSQLNERSLTLAEDILKNHPRARAVFCEVNDSVKNNKENLLHSAEMIKAICVNKSILTLNCNAHSKYRTVYFFAIKDNEQENTNDALVLTGKFKNRKNTSLYFFSTLPESQLVLANIDCGEMKIRRVDTVQNMIYKLLYEYGESIFRNAYKLHNGEKQISAVIMGLGKHGFEMLKALTWYCQMDGFHISIDAFDVDPSAESRIKAECPELLDPACNGRSIPGDAEYTITIHSACDFRTQDFADRLSLVEHPTFAFISLGDDSINIEAAAKMRMLFERMKVNPRIYAVLKNPDKIAMLKHIANFKGQRYHIGTLGDVKSIYTEKEIISSEIEEVALRLHMLYSSEESYWRYEYNHRSSIVRAIHRKARIDIGQLTPYEEFSALPEEEQEKSLVLEHKRWNAYMRTEGYVFSGSIDPQSRNDLAKEHNDLIDFYHLSESEKVKDIDITKS